MQDRQSLQVPKREFDRSRIMDGFEPGLIRASLGGESAVAYLPQNEIGRDFVVGDIHGMFPALEAALRKLEFLEGVDRLFSVGDLMDRGPCSSAANQWIREFPWFNAIRGNHDQMLLDALRGPAAMRAGVMELWLYYNGGEWWLQTDEQLRSQLTAAVAGLPLAAEVECECGRVGIVHADVPPDRDWPTFLDALCRGIREDAAYALWSRFRLRDFLSGALCSNDLAVAGVDLAVSGHVPLRSPIHAANRWWIDTGAAYSGRLADPKFTLLQINPGEPRVHTFRCSRSTR